MESYRAGFEELLLCSQNSITYVSNPDGSIHFVSDSVKNLLGYEKQTLLGKNLWSNLHEDDELRVKISTRISFERGETMCSSSYRKRHLNGSYVEIEASTVAKDGLFYTQEHCLSSPKKYSSNQYLSEKSSVDLISTENLQLPMSIVWKALKAYQKVPLTEEMRVITEEAQVAANYMQMTIKNNRRTAKLLNEVSLAPVLGTFNLTELIEQCKLMQESIIPCITFNVEIEPSVNNLIVSDKSWIFQMIMSLLSNAVEYAHQGYIFLKVRLDEQSKFLRFEVNNQGTRADILLEQKLFGSWKGSGTAEGSDGGYYQPACIKLGLYSVKIKAEKLGGNCGYHPPQLGVGSMIFFQVPYVLEQKIDPKTQAKDFSACQPLLVDGGNAMKEPSEAMITSRALTGTTALVIDDSVSIRKLMGRMLQSRGLKIEEAKSGLEGLDMMRRKKYRVVICDSYMPGMSGPDCLKRFRQWEKSNRPDFAPQYVIGISCRSLRFDPAVDEVDAVFSKPVEAKWLSDLLEMAAGKIEAEGGKGFQASENLVQCAAGLAC